jgi:hypothetical protein
MGRVFECLIIIFVSIYVFGPNLRHSGNGLRRSQLLFSGEAGRRSEDGSQDGIEMRAEEWAQNASSRRLGMVPDCRQRFEYRLLLRSAELELMMWRRKDARWPRPTVEHNVER